MQIVIDMPEEVKHNVNAYGLSLCPRDKEQLINAIKNGTPLPKGHGRLIDADEAIRKLCGKSCGCTLEECGYKVPCFSVQRINSAQIVIEADKEQEE